MARGFAKTGAYQHASGWLVVGGSLGLPIRSDQESPRRRAYLTARGALAPDFVGQGEALEVFGRKRPIRFDLELAQEHHHLTGVLGGVPRLTLESLDSHHSWRA